ncbi:MAG: HEAT repeat domain-containing protein [Planctomycetota bacterium]
MNLSWPERLFLAAVLLVAGAGILVALNALGVSVPLLSGRAPQAESLLGDDGQDEPPPLPDDAEDGLLAELDAGDAAWFDRHGPEARAEFLGPGGARPGLADPLAAGGDGGSRAGEGADGEDGEGKKGRDPLVDKLKAATDLTDPGQLMAFLIATFTPKGTKLGAEDLEFLFEALGEHDDWGVRNLLFAHLERIGGGDVTGGILEFLKSAKNPASLARALGALRSLKDDAAVTGIVEFLAGTQNRKLREVAFRNLLQTKSGAATASLLDVLDHSRDPQLTRYALAALSQLGGERGAQAVLEFASSSDPYERAIGQKSLRDIRDPAAVPALSTALERGDDPAIRTQVARTMGRIRDVSAVEPLGQAALYDESRAVRMESIRSLAHIGRAEAYPALRTISESDEDKGMRKAATRAIHAIERRETQRASRRKKRK